MVEETFYLSESRAAVRGACVYEIFMGIFNDQSIMFFTYAQGVFFREFQLHTLARLSVVGHGNWVYLHERADEPSISEPPRLFEELKLKFNKIFNEGSLDCTNGRLIHGLEARRALAEVDKQVREMGPGGIGLARVLDKEK